MKVCKKCGEDKEISEFSKQAAKPDGLRIYCRLCCSLEGKEYSRKNRTSINAYQTKWLKANPDKYIAKRDKGRKHRADYKKRNPHKSRLYTANRRAMLLKATPPWLTTMDKLAIADLYETAQSLSKFYNRKFHVDHVCPLIGVNSCGLHIPINLRIITEEENLSKGNKLII